MKKIRKNVWKETEREKMPNKNLILVNWKLTKKLEKSMLTQKSKLMGPEKLY